jgi:hypothetical protein
MPMTGALSGILVSHTMKKRGAIIVVICFFAVSACAESAQAQRGRHSAPHLVPAHRVARSYPIPAFWSDYYSDYAEPAAIESGPPLEIIQLVQAAQPAAQSTPPGEALILELQGDHWVRVATGAQSQLATASVPEPALSIASGRASTTQTATRAEQLPPAVLVFRDGHQEEITRYTIVGSTIVSNADYWTTGVWTQKIQIADLDVPETLRLNHQRGTQFKLPSSPDEVIVRP